MKKIINSIITKFKNICSIYKFLWNRSHKLVIFMFIEALLIAATPFPQILLTKYTIDMITQKYIFNNYVIVVLVLLFLLFIISLLKGLFNQLISRVKVYEITANLANDFFAKSMHIPYSYLNDKKYLDEREYAKSFVQGGCNRLIWNINDLISSIFTMLLSIYLLINVNFLSIIFVVILVVFQNKFQKKQFERNRKIFKDISANDRKYNYFNDAYCNNNYFNDIRLFNIPKVIDRKVKEILEKKQCLIKKQNNNNLSYSIQYNVINMISMLFIYFIILASIIYRNKDVGYFVVSINIINLLKMSLLNLSTKFNSFDDDIMYMKYFLNYMGSSTLLEIDYKEKCTDEHIDIKKIEFINVCFKYPNTDEYALKNINLLIENNQKIGLIGLNGSGKTTFLNLLFGFYDCTSGEILINDVNIKEYDKASLFASMSGIFQDYKLFSFTILDNISSLRENIHSNLLKYSIMQSGMDEIVSSLPKKEYTYINKIYDKDGVELSGGEIQKLTFARALYKNNSDVIIFDEPTASLDPIAEHDLYKKYSNIITNNISFFVSHRLSICKICDKIIYFKNGKIIDYGTHDELMTKNDEYRGMYELQKNSYSKKDEQN